MKITFRRTKAQIGVLFQQTFCSPLIRVFNLETSEHLIRDLLSGEQNAQLSDFLLKNFIVLH